MKDAALVSARLLLAWMFLASGWAALVDISGTGRYFAGLGLPFPTLAAWAVGPFEIVAGLMLVAGFMTRPAALALAGFAIVAGTLGHYGRGDDPFAAFMHAQAFMKDLAAAGGLLALAAAGPGRFSLDARW